MIDPPRDERDAGAPLNPALHQTTEGSHGTRFEGTDPLETVSVKDGNEGSSWPTVWAVVAVVGVLVTIYLLVS